MCCFGCVVIVVNLEGGRGGGAGGGGERERERERRGSQEKIERRGREEHMKISSVCDACNTFCFWRIGVGSSKKNEIHQHC